MGREKLWDAGTVVYKRFYAELNFYFAKLSGARGYRKTRKFVTRERRNADKLKGENTFIARRKESHTVREIGRAVIQWSKLYSIGNPSRFSTVISAAQLDRVVKLTAAFEPVLAVCWKGPGSFAARMF
jgi:hypothetical protein